MTMQNALLHGDCLQRLRDLPDDSVDMVFGDPPYNLQLKGDLWRPDDSMVDAVDDEWDQFNSVKAYERFTRQWLGEVRRVMKSDSATIWVCGTYHSIFRVGAIMQDMGFWLLNTVSWYRPNAMPNFRGKRLKNDVEYIIWAKHNQETSYIFNNTLLKEFNDFHEGKQLGCVWQINRIHKDEQLVDDDGDKLHPTQKPAELLKRIIIACTNAGDTVLDPFAGSGTTLAVAKEFRRKYIGIEQNEKYVQYAQRRIDATQAVSKKHRYVTHLQLLPRVAFKKLIEHGYLAVGQSLYMDNPETEAIITEKARLIAGDHKGTIHQLPSRIRDEKRSSNGWKIWYTREPDGTRRLLDDIRVQYREEVMGFFYEGTT